MLPRHQPDRIRIAFDDHRLVANAGLLLPAIPRPAPGPTGTRRPSPRPRRGAGEGQHGGQTASKGRGTPSSFAGTTTRAGSSPGA